MSVRELMSLGRQRQYDKLRRRYRSDEVYRAVVDMYRNVHGEPDAASHWMGLHDVEKYCHDDGTFRPLAAKYEQRELEFLVGRGIKLA